jgi:SagB-type dehydrogenase family enzyme
MQRLRTNPEMRLTWREPSPESGPNDHAALVARTYRSESGFEVGGSLVFDLLEYALTPRTPDELTAYLDDHYDDVDADGVLTDLLERGFLLTADADVFDDIEQWVEKGWRQALYFHLATRGVSFVDDGTDAGVERKRDRVDEFLEREGPPTLFEPVDGEETVPLPEPSPLPDESLASVLLRRRTSRQFAAEPIDPEALSTILHHACAPVADVRRHVAETAPDDPLTYMLSSHTIHEVYPVVLRSASEALAEGVYHYDMRDHELELLEAGTFADTVREVAIGQGIDGASVAFLVGACFDRYQWRYRHSRALRNLYVETASLAHRFLLSATAFDWGTFLTPALRDTLADDLTGNDGYREAISYLVAVGK